MERMYILIPGEFYKDKNLNGLERDVLALYKYYTENGKNKCCSLNSVQIAEVFNVSSRYIKRVRKHLSDLGYIRTDGGIKVTYIGLQVGSTVPTQGEPEFTPKGTTVHPRVNHSSPQKGTTVPLKGEPQFTHKEEKKEKEEEKRKKEGMKTNFDRLVELLPEDYRTQEKIDYIKGKYEDRINSIDSIDSAIDSWVINIKIELNKVFPMEYKIPMKKEEVSDTIDVF